jgi:hypothetical protein
MGAHPRSESFDEFDPRGICKTKTHLTWKGNDDKRREAGEEGNPTHKLPFRKAVVP